MKKEKKINIPDMSNWWKLDEKEIINLYTMLLDKMKEVLGEEEIFVLYQDFNHQYKYQKINIGDIQMLCVDYNKVNKLSCAKHYFGAIEDIYRKEEDVKKQCDLLNVEYIKHQIKLSKEKIDKLNPIQVMEDCEKQRKDEIIKYEQYKKQLKEIIGEEE